jgi:hypothetical protein
MTMQPTKQNSPSRGANRRFMTLATLALTLIGSAAIAQENIEARPYGQPSESITDNAAALGVYLVTTEGGVPALRLEGGKSGEAAMLLFSTEKREIELPGGATLLIGTPISHATGLFDAYGVWVHPLGEDLFHSDNDVLFVQGFQPVSTFGRMGAELSSGLVLSRRQDIDAPAETEPQLPEILVEEFAGMMGAGHLEAALDLALNSKDDAITLKLGGNLEVPVWAGVTVGGKVEFKASVTRGEDSDGAVIYDVAIGSDVAASAGVGIGVAGLGVSKGGGLDVIWRYASTHEVARALRSMAILQAVNYRLELACLAINTQLARINRGIDAARRRADRARRAVRSRMPWRNNALVKRMRRNSDRRRANVRASADRARRVVEQIIGWVAAERIFLTLHLHGYETRVTSTMEISAGTPGFGNSKEGGEWTFANLGASVAVGTERQFAVRVELVPESDAMFFEHKVIFTKSIKGAAGFGIGVAAEGKRVIELIQKTQIGTDGLQRDNGGTTVKLTLDGKLLGVLGAVVTGQFGVGGEVALELRLQDLLGYSADALSILLDDDTNKVANLLRAIPIKFHARHRYEAGVAIGIGIDIDGVFKAGIGGSAMLTDWQEGFEYQGGQILNVLEAGPVSSDDAGTMSTFNAVRDEVANVMRR